MAVEVGPTRVSVIPGLIHRWVPQFCVVDISLGPTSRVRSSTVSNVIIKSSTATQHLLTVQY